MKIDEKAIAMEMSKLASDIASIEVEGRWWPTIHEFIVYVPGELLLNTVISLCRRWSKLIRRSVPDRHDDWSTRIVIVVPSGREAGVFVMGWLGHEDTWVPYNREDPPDIQVWEALYRRLDEFLGARGKSDSDANGDYFLYNVQSGYADQNLTVYRLEFLTPELVSGIQAILRDGYADWIVYVCLDLQFPAKWTASEGVEIHADRVVEKWDRVLMTQVLGERLKI